MIGHSVATVEFQEPNLRAPVPECCLVIAATLFAGFRLMPAPHTNHEDLLLGCDRLQQFKDKKASQLRRVIRFHFRAETRQIEGEFFTPASFIQRLNGDSIFAAAMISKPRFDVFHLGLQTKLASAQRAVLAIDSGDASRVAYGALRGDKTTLAAMTRFHDNGV